MRSNLSALLAVLPSRSAAPPFMMAVVVVLCGFAASSPAEIVHYGNDVEFPDWSDHSPDYLLGSKYTVTQPIVLQKAGIIFKDFFISNAKSASTPMRAARPTRSSPKRVSSTWRYPA